ncbi:AMP-binding protein [Limibaculum sp. M0105]|uniref:3-methylmercaptopropionyl-CoA ligase n=1 Tax=Thermohalobaculum xanthum TaxID=2753746 RepID=A0A8J7SD19_9RHOB|nr:AMP-binding protein [Thermohalobaculum xanthum]MBK0399782.1 AMP-binding protein [Thermohalobaculum xanthum]
MKDLLTLGQSLSVHARLQPDRLGARDLERSLTFRDWNRRACRLANALLGLGLAKGERVAVLAYNCLEWAEIYAAVAKAGLIAVPINFRLTAAECAFCITDAEASALIAQADLQDVIEESRDLLSVPARNMILFGGPCPAGWLDYEDLLSRASDAEPDQHISAFDPWTLMYTSGTTGNPKGVVRNHRNGALLSLVTEIELGLGRRDDALLVMPMCHANSLYFFSSFAYCGAAVSIYSRRSFDPEHCLRALGETCATFTSLVPTHYIMMLGLSAAERGTVPLERVSKLMISSAPARADTKRQVMEMFPASGLFELYGSSEAGWVTMLHPDEQFTHLGTVGRECVGSAPIRLLDEHGAEVPDGEPGELFSSNPYTFEGYWKRPEKTAEAFRGDYCSVGDMALRTPDGFIKLIDRKKNMIISGGENVYPSEVEEVLGACPKVMDVAVIGLPDEKWGERVHGVVVLHAGAEATEAELIDWCRARIAGFKRPRSISIIAAAEMPRTATGKVLHRELRARFGAEAPRA